MSKHLKCFRSSNRVNSNSCEYKTSILFLKILLNLDSTASNGFMLFYLYTIKLLFGHVHQYKRFLFYFYNMKLGIKIIYYTDQ